MEDKKRNGDPTTNVLALVEAAVKRLDDLHAEANTQVDMQVEHLKELVSLRAEYQEKLTLAESKRIDAIRAVDVGAVAIASERAAQQATVLANQVVQSAETLRALVATTAQTVAASLAALSAQLSERIAALEKSSYVGSGRQAVADPMLTELVTEMKSLRESRSNLSGQEAAKTADWAKIVAIVMAAAAIGGVIVTVIGLLIRFYK